MSDNTARIKEICAQIVEEHGMMFIDFVSRGEGKVKVIELYIDGEEGVTVDICALISRRASKEIENEDLIEGPFRFEVSSPGVSRPLVFLKQYTKHIGRNFEVSYSEGEEIKKMKGTLLSIEEDKLTFEVNKESQTIGFNQIKAAKVKVSF
ncbi:MAG: ribosome maturation factor RimP [Ignavibacteriales bacterium]|jgi:Uncharacterized protein conserved in bacteria|nr:MAG: ribosome maturation factor RimP [Ignavibacteriaceae bacterium]MBW7873098.1 ribosome maturation factor RimP [Ignavibacteria bacterium]MCZ2142741.1 ribosome maturation factor RimP [Ignavibacteriales bacterium]OQY77136.1 MAG: hypothetical protein B6D45_03070 [Ignavibacteriales bacterium UTCHB3]MBV6443835.1 Ribosome maturation factor RimP [Ignavibacteriaceae bacterium]